MIIRKKMTEHIVVTNAEFLVVWRGFKMSVEGGSDRQQAGSLIVAAIRFPHGNVKFCQTFISFIDFHIFYFICELLLLLKPFCRTKCFAKVTKSCRNFINLPLNSLTPNFVAYFVF